MKAFAALTALVCPSFGDNSIREISRRRRTSAAALISLLCVLGADRANAQPSHFRNPKPGGFLTVPLFIGFGDPLPAVAGNYNDLTNFSNGLLNFQETETLNPATDAS
jgi:hypothetical protein